MTWKSARDEAAGRDGAAQRSAPTFRPSAQVRECLHHPIWMHEARNTAGSFKAIRHLGTFNEEVDVTGRAERLAGLEAGTRHRTSANSNRRVGDSMRTQSRPKFCRRLSKLFCRGEPTRHSTICGKEGVRHVIPASVEVFPGGCLGLRGENARLVRGRHKNFPGMGLAQKRGYDSDEDQEPQPRFFSSRIEHQSGLELAAKIRRCKARARAMGAGD